MYDRCDKYAASSTSYVFLFFVLLVILWVLDSSTKVE